MANSQNGWQPAGWQRAERVDAEVLAEARRRLGTADYRELRKIECDCAGGVLTLRGTVRWYHLKQRAFGIVANLDGVRRVSNDIDVRSRDESD